VRLLVPSHDGSIQAFRARRAEVERRTFLPLASEAALDIVVSKTRTLALAEELGIAVPRSILVSDSGDVRAAISDLGLPAVVKPIRSWGEQEGLGTRVACESVLNVEEALRRVEAMQAAGGQILIQEWLPGRRDAVTFFYLNDTIWARFAQTSYREFPPLGGSSVLCESISPLADLVEPAERLVRAMSLEGCPMVEFRRDHAGRPVLMEVNPRLAGSVELAISAGVDFPTLLHSWAVGAPLQKVTSYRVGLRQRWLVGDLENLRCTFAALKRPDASSPAQAVATFLFDFVRRPSQLAVVDARDMMPALVELRHAVIEPTLKRVYRSTLGRLVTKPLPERSDESK
jgi:predicted ATP-grasp superfamily ATP-dependent carboligase